MKKKVTLPRVYRPGKGHPPETLAYLSPAEHDLIRQLTDGKWDRGPKGVRSYADDSASSKGVSRGDSSGTKGSSGIGQGGQTGGGSKASSSPAGGVSTGGGLRGAGSNTGPGSGRPGSSSSPSSGVGGQRGAGSNYGPGSANPAMGGGLSGVARAAQANASGTATNWGGSQYSPGQMYSNPSRSASALRSVVNGINLAGGSNAQKTDAMLRNMGYNNPMGRAGMLGTFQHESQFTPDAVGDLNYKNHAYGLGQWRNDRWDNMQNFAANNGLPKNDIATQAAFAGTELANQYGSAFRGVQNATSVRDAVAAMNGYERPKGWSAGGDPTRVSGWNDRLNNANSAFAAMAQPPSQVASAAPLGQRPEPAGITPFANMASLPKAPNIVGTSAPVSETAPSIWQKPDIGGWIKAKTGVDVGEVAKQASWGNKWVAEHPVLAKVAGAVMGGPGAAPRTGGAFGNPQDRSNRYIAPQAPQAPQMASAGGRGPQAAPDPLAILQSLQANMIAQGAKPEDLAYVQSIIDELTKAQVA